jgi:uncharacterized protein (TIGR03067 family)
MKVIMRLLLLLACAALPLGFAAAPAVRPDAAAEDLKSIQGTWDLVEEVESGRLMPPRAFRAHFAGKALLIRTGGADVMWAFSLDASTSPRTIEWRGPLGVLLVLPRVNGRAPFKAHELVVKGSYALNGDTLRIAYNMDHHSDRPKDLTGRHPHHSLRTFRRRPVPLALPPLLDK